MKRRLGAVEKKDFELERVSLFSDAVFAIAITLLVIDIKWPELPEDRVMTTWDPALWPMAFSFVGFILSFYFIGRFWQVHLRLFRLVKRYDEGLIHRNLLFLFFIVTFPFTASGLFGRLRSDFALPLYIYMANLMLVSAANFHLCRYIFHVKPYLGVEGQNEEKKYFYVRSLYSTYAMVGSVGVVLVVSLIFPKRMEIIGPSCASAGIFLRMANKKSNRIRPPGHF
jgi:uncharacterized membrane protein